MVSVVIPIFNKVNTIDKCINSIISQNFADYEIILVDDGSTDASCKVCEKYLCPNIRLIKQSNSGVSVARNTGLENARGDWIAFIDPDDYISKDYLNMLMGSIDKETDIVACCCIAVTDHGYFEDHFYKSNRIFADASEKTDLLLQLMDSEYGKPEGQEVNASAIGVPWGKIYRKKFLVENHLYFDPGLKRMQDNIFNMYAFDKARKIIYIDKCLYYYSMDNISYFRDGKYRYNSYYKKNISILLKHRKKFLEAHNLLKNNIIRSKFYCEILAMINGALNLTILNPENPKSRKEKKAEIRKLLKSTGAEVTNQLPLSDIHGTSIRFISICLRLHSIDLLMLIWKLKMKFSVIAK